MRTEANFLSRNFGSRLPGAPAWEFSFIQSRRDLDPGLQCVCSLPSRACLVVLENGQEQQIIYSFSGNHCHWIHQVENTEVNQTHSSISSVEYSPKMWAPVTVWREQEGICGCPVALSVQYLALHFWFSSWSQGCENEPRVGLSLSISKINQSINLYK